MPDAPITIADITQRLEAWAPAWSAESWDNSGLQLGRPERPVSRGLIALDLTPAVIQEAAELGAELIITHHPAFFEPIKSITPATLVGSMALELAERRIAHYAIHTNLDAARDGVSFALARQLDLTDVSFLAPSRPDLANPDLETGFGAMGRLPESMAPEAFLAHILERLNLPMVRHASGHREISSVAVCGGSGTSFLNEALAAGADAFVTADIKYHQYFDVLDDRGHPRLTYVDVGHYESERITEHILVSFLKRHVPGVSWAQTRSRTAPVETYSR